MREKLDQDEFEGWQAEEEHEVSPKLRDYLLELGYEKGFTEGYDIGFREGRSDTDEYLTDADAIRHHMNVVRLQDKTKKEK